MITVGGPAARDEVRLAHPLYGEVIASRLGSLRAREIRLQLTGVVQARPQLTPDDSLRVCVWSIDAGEAPPPQMLIDAARAANLSVLPISARSSRAGP
jgi:hypothetical protein